MEFAKGNLFGEIPKAGYMKSGLSVRLSSVETHLDEHLISKLLTCMGHQHP